MQVVPAKRAIAVRYGAQLVTIVDQHAEAAAEQRQRDAQLDAVALFGRLPRAVDSRLVDGFLPAVLASLDAARVHVTRTGGRKEHLPFDAGGVLEADPDAVAERCGVE